MCDAYAVRQHVIRDKIVFRMSGQHVSMIAGRGVRMTDTAFMSEIEKERDYYCHFVCSNSLVPFVLYADASGMSYTLQAIRGFAVCSANVCRRPNIR